VNAYLQPADYEAYGIAGATAAQVEAASRAVDAYLGTTSGLTWLPDATGNPGWMAGLAPVRTFTLASATLAGTGTLITVTGAAFGPGHVGQAVVIDRADSHKAETCIVIAATGGTLTMESTAFAHDLAATVDFGLTISEEAKVGRDGMIRTNARPMARLLSLYGTRRYGSANLREASFEELLATNYNQATLWGGFPLNQCDVDTITGSCYMLPGSVAAYPEGSRIRVNYLAGWSYANLPGAIKQAVASQVQSVRAYPEMAGNIQTLKAGDATITRFKTGSVGPDVMSLLAPYRTLRLT
jgi:hypothetical protein